MSCPAHRRSVRVSRYAPARENLPANDANLRECGGDLRRQAVSFASIRVIRGQKSLLFLTLSGTSAAGGLPKPHPLPILDAYE